MTNHRSTYVDAAGFEVHVSEWGDPAKPALVMWHGLARTGRDFDEAADALSDDYFIICPDTLGRGLSTWPRPAETGYTFEAYMATAMGILDHYKISSLRWVGTSMGGLIGMSLAAHLLKDRISHLIINDIGPYIAATGADRIANYVSNPPVFATMAELEIWLKKTYISFGENTDAFWRRMTDTSARRTDDGQITLHLDPAIGTLFSAQKNDIDLWPVYDAITAKTLVIRGESSDILSKDVADGMVARGPKAKLEIITDCGHAPTLANSDQIDLLRRFLTS